MAGEDLPVTVGVRNSINCGKLSSQGWVSGSCVDSELRDGRCANTSSFLKENSNLGVVENSISCLEVVVLPWRGSDRGRQRANLERHVLDKLRVVSRYKVT